MPDSDVVTLLSSVRAELAVVAGRRDELQSQLAEVEREHARLAAAVSVIEERQGSSSSDGLPDSRSLADEILDELSRSPGMTRAQLLRVFSPRGLNESTVMSAVGRLRKRRAVVKRGRCYSRVDPGAAAGSPPSAAVVVASARSDVDRSPPPVDPAAPEVVPAAAVAARSGPVPDPLVAASDPDAHPSGSGKDTNRARVWDAVATSAACTRPELVTLLATQGVPAGSVDTAIAGLKKRGALEQRAGRVLVALQPSDAPSVSAGVSPPSS